MSFIFFILFQSFVFASSPITTAPVIVSAERILRPQETRGEAYLVEPTRHTSLAQVLRDEPAIQIQPGFEDTVSIRGQDPIQTRTFLEGIPLTDTQFQSSNLRFFPLEASGNLTVYTDALPVTYGEDGLGGGIDFQLAEKHNVAGARAGSFGAVRALARPVLLSGRNKGSLHLQYDRSEENFSYYDDNGTPFEPTDDTLKLREHNQRQTFSVLPEFKFNLSKNHSIRTFSLNTIAMTQVPGSIATQQKGDLEDVFNLTAFRHNWSEPDFDFQQQLYARIHSDNLRGISTPSVSLSDSDSQEMTLGYRVGAVKSVGTVIEIRPSTGFETSEYSHQSQVLPSLAHRRSAVPVGVSVRTQHFSNRLSLTPSLLLHYYRYTSQDGAGDRDAIGYSPRVEVDAIALKGVGWKTTVGSFYRAPSLYELYGSAGTSPNPDLAMEKALRISSQLDWNIRKSATEDVVLSYAYSFASLSNLIAHLPNSQNTQIATNVGRSQIQSHEVFLSARKSHFRVRPALTWMTTRNLSAVSFQNGKELPNRPRAKIQIDLGYEKDAWEAGYGFTYFGTMFSDLANERLISPFVVHSVHVAFQSRDMGAFRLDVQNLTNVLSLVGARSGFSTTENYGWIGFPSPGRRINLSWIYEV